MLVESFGAYNYFGNESKRYERYHSSGEPMEELTYEQKNMLMLIIFVYVFTTIYVALKYPIGGDVVISIILALFFSTIFWFIKIIELIIIGYNNNNKSVVKSKVGKKSVVKSKYNDPIY
jgi:hypothetical protein